MNPEDFENKPVSGANDAAKAEADRAAVNLLDGAYDGPIPPSQSPANGRDGLDAADKPGTVIAGEKLETADKKVGSPAKETDEQRKDAFIERVFGKEVMANIKNHDWLCDHIDELKAGFKSKALHNHPDYTLGQVAARMKELSGGLIYSQSSEGSKFPFSNTFPDRYFDIYLQRDLFDTRLLREVTSNNGLSMERKKRW